MTLNDQKSALSEAWVRAVAATAGFGVQPGTVPDDQSADLTITSMLLGPVINPRLDVQLKCSHIDYSSGDVIAFPLPQNNYDALRNPNVCVPMILVLLEAPDPVDSWLTFLPDHLELRRRAWWHSLHGLPSSGNLTNTTVYIPDSQRLNPASLIGIMNILRDGGSL
jgi:hypothetical protein